MCVIEIESCDCGNAIGFVVISKVGVYLYQISTPKIFTSFMIFLATL